MPSLNWIGKEAVTEHHEAVPLRLLRCDKSLSHGDFPAEFAPGIGNLLVEGDNLHALRSLLPYYKGKIKCITIDPPYNTGNEGWIYNDNVNSPQIRQWLGKAVDREDLTRHDKWLCMMYPRLRYHHELLREDGAIFISIDDNEVANLRLLMDEVFGERNFVANIVWQKRTSPDARLHLGAAHDHVIVYARDIEKIKFNKLSLSENQRSSFKNPDNDPKDAWVSTDFTAQGWRPNQMYTITTPSGVQYEPPPGRCWANIEEEYLKLRAQGRIWFGKNGDARPRVKTYLFENEGISSWTWWLNSEAGHNQEATKELATILGPSSFDTPKPVRLIKRILEIATDPGDVILDSFAGSGTTGHAAMQLNRENPDLPPRRFILVEIESDVARPVTRERLKRAIDGYGDVLGLGGEFRFCHLGVPLVGKNGELNPAASWRDMAYFLFLKRF
ncbi:MAG: site-specific DNA-methyltransferase, partial [Abitibacteriaceae bacterium]|nr:site-specific DNA-methyltransferase [Abditibacteriaceae bacterium]